MEERCEAGAALERLGGTAAGAPELERQRVALGPAGAADHGLQHRGEVRGALGGAGLADRRPVRWRPGHVGGRGRAVADVVGGGGVGGCVVDVLGADRQVRRTRAGLVGAELDVGVGDRRTLGDLEPSEPQADDLLAGAVGGELEVRAGQLHRVVAQGLFGVIAVRVHPHLDRLRAPTTGRVHDDLDRVGGGQRAVVRRQPERVGAGDREGHRGVLGGRARERRGRRPGVGRPEVGQRRGCGQSVVCDGRRHRGGGGQGDRLVRTRVDRRSGVGRVDHDGHAVARPEGAVVGGQLQHVGAGRGEAGGGVDRGGVAEGDGSGTGGPRPAGRHCARGCGVAVVADGAVQGRAGGQGDRLVGTGVDQGWGVAGGGRVDGDGDLVLGGQGAVGQRSAGARRCLLWRRWRWCRRRRRCRR